MRINDRMKISFTERRSAMNFGAIIHMPDSRYCFCLEPGRFLVRLQTGKGDISKVIMHYQDKYIPVRFLDTRKTVAMVRVASDHFRDYYEAEITIDVVCLRYYFELLGPSEEKYYYSNCRILGKEPDDVDRMFDLPQNLREIERFQVPSWAKNSIVYQIFPARFASSHPVADKQWYKTPMKATDDIKGDLKGLISRLDYIKNLGVDIVYMTPIFHSKSSHKYDTIDYYTIDPGFGTTEDLIKLVDKAHSLGMKVMLDGVFNHTAPEFFAFSDLEKNYEASPYRNWYYCQGKPVRPKLFGVKPNYKCFSYFGGMPKLNLENPETGDYFIDVALYWMRIAGIDGWRLDVGDEVSHRYWYKFRNALKAEFPDALIAGEVWHYAADFLQGDNWDTVMNYPFKNAVMDFVAKEDITASELLAELGFLRGNLHSACYPLMWNLIDSHDTPRALHQCGENKDKLRLLAAFQLLLPGMPFLYYGDEVGMTGGPDPDCRRGMLWDPDRQDRNLLRYYQRLIAIRKQFSCLTEGDAVSQTADDDCGVVIIDRGELLLIFHGRSGTVMFPKWKGAQELISGTAFDGTIGSYQAAVLRKY